MNEVLRKILDNTQDVHTIIPIDEGETAEKRMLEKQVLESRIIDDMESLEHFVPITPWAKLELTSERFLIGTRCLKMSCPTNLDTWDTERGHGQGRIYDIPSAYRKIDNEDWTDWNRISVWIYPDSKGMKSLNFRIQLHNDGEHKVPDIYDREGGHNFNLKADCWNHIILEMPYVARDKIIGISFDYDMVGHEPDAVDHATWYIDNLELQKVKCDVFEGWIPAEDRISYSNSGYQTGSHKTAIASDIDAKTFKLIETKTGRVVLEKAIDNIDNKLGKLQVMDFSEVIDEGEYIIVAGSLSTRVFTIANDVWESSVWKVLNFFLVLRCGHEVVGKHRACHTDMLLTHNGKSVVANGGWHDAGDLAQGMNNTSEATQALFTLALSLKGKNDRLYKRVLEEAKWGLDYVIKTRFGDGYRASYSSCSIWTDGIIGTDDDIVSVPTRCAYANFDASYAMALGAKALATIDPDYAAYALKIAKEDFTLGTQILEELEDDVFAFGNQAQFNRGDYITPQINSIACLAGTELYDITKEDYYKEKAIAHSLNVVACQQREYTTWEKPMIGFYYEDKNHSLIWHHNHMSYAYLPDLAMSTLCKAFPQDENYMLWYSALKLSGINYTTIGKYTAPYGVVPSGIYHIDEAINQTARVIPNHPIMNSDGSKDITDNYGAKVAKGFPLGDGYYLRVYPVWFSFRGNYNVILSDGKASAEVAGMTNNLDLYNLSQRQFEWIVGKNPMAQSTLYGEGYDYIQLYAVQPGQTVGAISVGMQSNGDNDEPFWPQVNNATYKEVWVCSATKWMWGMSNSFCPAVVSGYLAVDGNSKGDISFKHKLSGKIFVADVHERTGYFNIELPSGGYEISHAKKVKNMNIISGNSYSIDGELYDLNAKYQQNGNEVTITATLCGNHSLPIELKAYNLAFSDKNVIIEVENGCGKATIKAKLINPEEPFTCIVLPNGKLSERVEVEKSDEL